jgi:O-antigen/teichoic acid export membrane protein
MTVMHKARGKHARPKRRLRIAHILGDKGTLPGKASRAAGWSLANSIATRIGGFGINIILARMLGPHDFGVYAVALVALAFAQNFNELGVSLAIVRWEGEPSEIVPTVATISVTVSVVTCGACLLGAGPFAKAMGSPDAAGVVRVLALAILIDGFANTPSGLLQRQFRQGKMAIAAQVGVWVGTPLTVALARSGYGAMSLAVGQLAGAFIVVVIAVAFAPESLRFGFDPGKVRALLRFGLPLAGSNLVAVAVMTIDQIVVGHVLGAAELGFYVLALNVASWPLNMLSRPVRSVAPAIFSRLQHDPRAMQDTFVSTVGLVTALALPVCLALAGSARPLVGLIYGARWLPAARPLVWLALLAAARILFEPAYDYLVVLTRSRFVLLLQVAWLLALIPALVAGTNVGGITGAALAEVAVAVVAILPCYLAGLKNVGISLGDLRRRLAVPVAAGALAGLTAWAVVTLAAGDVMALAVTGAVTIASVAFACYRMRALFGIFRKAPAAPPGASREQLVGVLGSAAVEAGERTITPSEAARHVRTSWPVAHAAFATAPDLAQEQVPALVSHPGIDERQGGTA